MKKSIFILMAAGFLCLSITSCTKTVENVIDVDLTILSSTMVYAEVFNMMSNPDEYIGKTVKANGPYATSAFEGGIYHFVLVEGIDSCCPEGLMFIWNGDHSYPDDYPKEMTMIEIIGVFGSYDGFDFPYYYFSVDEMTILG